tara:strand:- start:59 stop:784 length:726 start_codon:yes stop_codon:yes gene_type:complete
MKTLIVIPARWNSSRFPGKPLALINGKEMIKRVWEQCLKSKEADDVIVATDNKKIFNFCIENNIKIIMTSNKHKTGTDRVGEVSKKINADIYVNVQGDEPLIKFKNIDLLIRKLKKNKNYDVVLGYYNLKKIIKYNDYNPTYLVKNKFEEVLYLSRSQIPFFDKSKKNTISISLGLFAFTKEGIKNFSKLKVSYLENIEKVEMIRFLENNYKILSVKLNEVNASVDYPSDIKKVEKIIKNK